MNKLHRWFIISLLLLVSCTPIFNPSPTATESLPVDPDVTPQNSPVSPTVAPENSPIPPAWDLQIRITTTSDWTAVRLVEGVIINDYIIHSASQGADTASYDQDLFQLIQPIEQANSGQSVEMVVDLSLEKGFDGADLILEIDRGHIGETTVEIYDYSCGQPGLVETLTWDGIQPSGENTKRFTVPLAQSECATKTVTPTSTDTHTPEPPPSPSAPSVERFPHNPIVVPEMLPGNDGANINGPSLIRVPSWVEHALGQYYLYFAHHVGTYIRMAYADDLAGPWKVYDEGTLQLKDTICDNITESIYADYKHVASPDVHVDTKSRQIRMYFHCPVYIAGPRANNDSYKQVTLVATSSDGLSFEAASEPLGDYYFRVFQWAEYSYALGMPGIFYRSADGLSGFEEGPTLFSADMRHSAVIIRDGRLLVFYTMVGDNPERILLSEIELRPDWMTWSTTGPVVVLEPEFDWEGANLPHEPSVRGEVMEPVRQLRDPAIFVEEGRTFLLYSVAGESGIAIAELHWH